MKISKICLKTQDSVQKRSYALQIYVLECEGCDCGEDGLGGKMAGSEIGGREGQDFEGEAFGLDHYEAGEGEADHGEPVVEGWVTVRKSLMGDGFGVKLPLLVRPGQQLRPATKRT